MAPRERIEAFIEHLYRGRRPSFSKNEILRRAQREGFEHELLVLFEELPEQFFDEEDLYNAVNVVIQLRGRERFTGGYLRLPQLAGGHAQHRR